ncbi:hypothetical protein [Cupriavidus sp. DF5525]|uniref:hypothetical protein n=1 Tax=Cupriavidus sp. DF5525 TaxID=3160989 RepID=UPI0032E00216
MKLSERLLEIFDVQVAVDRAKIIEQAPDLDALGEILAAAHYAGVEIEPDCIHAHGDSILLTGSQRVAALEWMLRSGFSLQSASPSDYYLHNRLAHPGLRCLVVILTPLERKVRS